MIGPDPDLVESARRKAEDMSSRTKNQQAGELGLSIHQWAALLRELQWLRSGGNRTLRYRLAMTLQVLALGAAMGVGMSLGAEWAQGWLGYFQ